MSGFSEAERVIARRFVVKDEAVELLDVPYWA